MGDIIRIGKVSAVNPGKRLVRVQFSDVGITSGWLKVLKSPPFIGNKSVNEGITETAELHFHDLKIMPWFPSVGDVVLCLYNPGFNEDGYVIGGL